jgi:hypothetical protein
MTHQNIKHLRPELEPVDPPFVIIVYICPTPRCGNYYAAKDFRLDRTPDLDAEQERRNPGTGEITSTFTRTECPDCRQRGIRVERVPYAIASVIELSKILPLPPQARPRPRRLSKRPQIAG